MKDLYEKMRDKIPFNYQVDRAIEEMSELTAVLLQERGGKGNLNDVVKEIADVDFTLGYLKSYIKSQYPIEYEEYQLKFEQTKLKMYKVLENANP